jgi:hypothetical protein
MNERGLGAVYTLVRISTLDSTRPFTEMQSDTPWPNRDDSNKGKQKENSMTRKILKATGAEFMYPNLTGSSLRNY